MNRITVLSVRPASSTSKTPEILPGNILVYLIAGLSIYYVSRKPRMFVGTALCVCGDRYHRRRGQEAGLALAVVHRASTNPDTCPGCNTAELMKQLR